MRHLLRRRPRGLWADVDVQVAWLDANATEQPRWWWSQGHRRAVRDHELTLRLAKCAEEVGEVIDARIREQGRNPRKGNTGTGEDVASELCDVVMTALVALTTQTGSVDAARAHLEARFAVLRDRATA